VVFVFRFSPEEFIVEEIRPDGTILELNRKMALAIDGSAKGENFFTHFILQKRQWNTHQAIKEIASRLHVSEKRFSFAGTKDRNSISTQLCSVYGVEQDKVAFVTAKDISINGAWIAREKIRLGDLLGNRFTVILNEENCGKKVAGSGLLERAEQKNFLVPNFFGEQRFGLRQNTHLIGKKLVEGNYASAVMDFLCAGEDELGKEAREKLREEKDFAKALAYFPKHLKYERTVLSHLAQHPTDFIGAFRKLPRTLQLMFVHACQSFLFNKMLEKRIAEGNELEAREQDFYCEQDFFGFPDLKTVKEIDSGEKAQEITRLAREKNVFLTGRIIGSETKLNAQEQALLEQEGVSQEGFLLKSIPELASKGALRALFIPLKDFEVLQEFPAKIRFSLPSGSYATVALRELLK
jgi:tRNA pseudouridine13 synthase